MGASSARHGAKPPPFTAWESPYAIGTPPTSSVHWLTFEEISAPSPISARPRSVRSTTTTNSGDDEAREDPRATAAPRPRRHDARRPHEVGVVVVPVLVGGGRPHVRRVDRE